MRYIKTELFLILIFACMNLVFAKDSQPTATDTQKNETKVSNAVEFTDPKRPIVVEKLQPRFTVRLQSNITTGYSWFIKAPMDASITPIKYVYHRPNGQAPGTPGFEEWLFSVKPEAFAVPQTMDLVFLYSRPWELEEAKKVQIKIFTR